MLRLVVGVYFFVLDRKQYTFESFKSNINMINIYIPLFTSRATPSNLLIAGIAVYDRSAYILYI